MHRDIDIARAAPAFDEDPEGLLEAHPTARPAGAYLPAKDQVSR